MYAGKGITAVKGKFGKVLMIDIAATVVFSLLFFIIGLISGGNVLQGLEAIKNGLFFLAALLLFLLAGMFLVKEKTKRFGSKRVIGLTAVIFLAAGSAVDFYLL